MQQQWLHFFTFFREKNVPNQKLDAFYFMYE